MAKRGRKPKVQAVTPVVVDHAKLLKQFEQEQQIQLETMYKELAFIKHEVNIALNKIGFIDSCENLGEAAFKAGRAYDNLDKANDKLQEFLDNIYDNNNFDHWDDIIENDLKL